MWLKQSEGGDQSTEVIGHECEELGSLQKDIYWVKWEPIESLTAVCEKAPVLCAKNAP